MLWHMAISDPFPLPLFWNQDKENRTYLLFHRNHYLFSNTYRVSFLEEKNISSYRIIKVPFLSTRLHRLSVFLTNYRIGKISIHFNSLHLAHQICALYCVVIFYII